MYYSIVIPTRNRIDFLAKCLQKIQICLQRLDGVEVIVSDDSRDNNTLNLMRNQFPWVTYVKGPQKGPAANRNNGLKYSQGDWIIFMDDDCLPHEDCVKEYIKNIVNADSSICAFEGAILPEKTKKRYDEIAPININGGAFFSCNVAVKKEVLINLKGFDELFPYPTMEDLDLYLRLKKVGKIPFIYSAQVIHPWRKGSSFKINDHISSVRYFNLKHSVNINPAYRYSRLKIFIGLILFDFHILLKYRFKGSMYYWDKINLYFRLIFI